MKLLSFTILMFFSLSSNAVEFNSCTDDKGHTHFTNLPKSSLDSNCAPENHYTVMLNQDYLNLFNGYKKYVAAEKEPGNIVSLESFSQPVKDILDPDKALDMLVDSSLKKDENAAKKFFKARTNAVEQILNEDKQSSLSTVD